MLERFLLIVIWFHWCGIGWCWLLRSHCRNGFASTCAKHSMTLKSKAKHIKTWWCSIMFHCVPWSNCVIVWWTLEHWCHVYILALWLSQLIIIYNSNKLPKIKLATAFCSSCQQVCWKGLHLLPEQDLYLLHCLENRAKGIRILHGIPPPLPHKLRPGPPGRTIGDAGPCTCGLEPILLQKISPLMGTGAGWLKNAWSLPGPSCRGHLAGRPTTIRDLEPGHPEMKVQV